MGKTNIHIRKWESTRYCLQYGPYVDVVRKLYLCESQRLCDDHGALFPNFPNCTLGRCHCLCIKYWFVFKIEIPAKWPRWERRKDIAYSGRVPSIRALWNGLANWSLSESATEIWLRPVCAEDVSIELVSLREDWGCYTARIIWVNIQMGGQLPLWTRYYFEWDGAQVRHWSCRCRPFLSSFP